MNSCMNHLQLNEYQCCAIDRLGIASLTPMQEEALFAARQTNSIVLLSPTGTGKTLAFLLPLIERLQLKAVPCVQAMIVVPDRKSVV